MVHPDRVALIWWRRRVDELERRVNYLSDNRGAPRFATMTFSLEQERARLDMARRMVAQLVAEILEGEHDGDDH